MKLTTVKEIYRNREQYLDKEITVGGWVRSVRDSKAFGFIVLHDGSFFRSYITITWRISQRFPN
jgi:asparaginyl-tRNA synthetase